MAIVAACIVTSARIRLRTVCIAAQILVTWSPRIRCTGSRPPNVLPLGLGQQTIRLPCLLRKPAHVRLCIPPRHTCNGMVVCLFEARIAPASPRTGLANPVLYRPARTPHHTARLRDELAELAPRNFKCAHRERIVNRHLMNRAFVCAPSVLGQRRPHVESTRRNLEHLGTVRTVAKGIHRLWFRARGGRLFRTIIRRLIPHRHLYTLSGQRARDLRELRLKRLQHRCQFLAEPTRGRLQLLDLEIPEADVRRHLAGAWPAIFESAPRLAPRQLVQPCLFGSQQRLCAREGRPHPFFKLHPPSAGRPRCRRRAGGRYRLNGRRGQCRLVRGFLRRYSHRRENNAEKRPSHTHRNVPITPQCPPQSGFL